MSLPFSSLKRFGGGKFFDSLSECPSRLTHLAGVIAALGLFTPIGGDYPAEPRFYIRPGLRPDDV